MNSKLAEIAINLKLRPYLTTCWHIIQRFRPMTQTLMN